MRTGSHQRAVPVALLLAALLLSRSAFAESPQAAMRPGERPVIALIIDDLGNLRGEGLRALELRGPVTYAFLPHTPHAAGLARLQP